MPDDPTPPTPPADPPADPPQDPPVDPPVDDFDRERAMATIHKQREEAKELRRQLKEAGDLKARLDALEQEKLTAEERQAKRLAELEAQQAEWEIDRQEQRLKLAVYSRRDELGLADVDLALAALDRSALEYAADGTVSNLDDVVKSLLEAKPILKATASGGSRPAGSLNAGDGQGKQPVPALTTEELAAAEATGTKPEVYAAMKGVTTLDDYLAAQERLKQ